MKINLSLMRFSTISDHHEIINEEIETDKIIIETKGKIYEIKVSDIKNKEYFAYPNQFMRCLVITESKGVRKLHGFFSKILLYIDTNEYFLGVVSIEEIFYRDEINKYFEKQYKLDRKVEKVDVQTISVDDFVVQSRISMMKEARVLFKRRKNVK